MEKRTNAMPDDYSYTIDVMDGLGDDAVVEKQIQWNHETKAFEDVPAQAGERI